ncbi:MAG: hypothetical protein MZV64_20805 [Ignavibacteriales bacterium]|nr:hypothetical protein [Ignavibacteriales bacterium]
MILRSIMIKTSFSGLVRLEFRQAKRQKKNGFNLSAFCLAFNLDFVENITQFSVISPNILFFGFIENCL